MREQQQQLMRNGYGHKLKSVPELTDGWTREGEVSLIGGGGVDEEEKDEEGDFRIRLRI